MFSLLVVLLCLLLNALLSCIEMAFVTVSKPHLKKMAASGDRIAKKLIEMKTNPERVLSVLQIGITLVGAISAAVGGAGAEEHLSPRIMQAFGVSERASEVISLVLVVLPITYLSVVIGELVPKTLALRNPMRFARIGVQVLKILDRLFAPVVFMLEISTKLILSFFSSKQTLEQLQESGSSVDIESLPDHHKQYVLNLIDVDKRRVKDIMLPWKEVTVLESDMHPHAILNVIKEAGHTRMPVIEDEKPIGLLHAKEFISQGEISRIDWLQLIRPILTLSPNEAILNALKMMQTMKSHMAVIANSEGKAIGIVTLEDIFEEVVGDISDEDDDPRVLLSANSKLRTMSLGKK